MLFPTIPAVWFGSELSLLLPAQVSSVLLESEQHWQERSSIIPQWQQEAAAELCSHPAMPPARSHRCWELLTRKGDSAGWLKGFVYCYRNGNS